VLLRPPATNTLPSRNNVVVASTRADAIDPVGLKTSMGIAQAGVDEIATITPAVSADAVNADAVNADARRHRTEAEARDTLNCPNNTHLSHDRPAEPPRSTYRSGMP
jgi:hypothetical protein